MALAKAVAGALRPSQVITWTREDGTPETLTGATLTGVIIPVYDHASARAIAGALNITDGANGVFTWEYDAADVVAGKYLVQFTAVFGSDPTPAKTFAASWVVAPAY